MCKSPEKSTALISSRNKLVVISNYFSNFNKSPIFETVHESNYYWYANPDISTDTTFIKWLTKGKGNYIDNQYFKEYEK